MVKINTASFVKWSQEADCMLLIGSVTNIIELFIKAVVIPAMRCTRSPALNNAYFRYINDKSFIKCAVLATFILAPAILWKNSLNIEYVVNQSPNLAYRFDWQMDRA